MVSAFRAKPNQTGEGAGVMKGITMEHLVAFIDELLNGKRKPRRIGFTLICYPYGATVDEGKIYTNQKFISGHDG